MIDGFAMQVDMSIWTLVTQYIMEYSYYIVVMAGRMVG